MEIKKIVKDKKDTYKIFLEDEELITSDDIILKYQLLYKDNIDNDLLNKIKEETIFYEQYNKVLNFVLKKLHSEKEVKNYMTKLNLSDEQKDIYLNKLKEKGFLNDTNYTKAYVSEKLNLTNDGPLKIANYLESQDIDSLVIEEVLSNYQDAIKEKLIELVKKKKDQNDSYSDYVWKQKVVYYLMGLGYEQTMIEDIYDTIPRKNMDNIQKREYGRLKSKLSKRYSGEELERQIKIKLAQKGFFE